MKIYLDDERKTPDDWVRTHTPKETIDLLRTNYVTEISLDHDLGDDEGIGTGYDVLLWIEEQVFCHGYEPPVIKVHSANSSAREKMQRGIASIERMKDRNET